MSADATAHSVAATARVVATREGTPVLRSGGPFALRRTRPRRPGAGSGRAHTRVTVVGAMSAPLGGDRLALEAEARAGARLDVDSAAATISLPGRDGAPAHYDLRLTVADGAELRWLPEQTVLARGSDLRARTLVHLAPGARLVLREELVLGRYGEESGTAVSRLTVHRAGRPLLDQELAVGPGAPPGWDGGAVLGGHRAAGQLLVVEPAPTARPPEPRLLGGTAVLTPLAGPAYLVTALARDARELRAILRDAEPAD